MKRKDLVNHIQGSYLKNQHLEAFLAQSAYIEGILKLLADVSFFRKITAKIPVKDRDTDFIKVLNDKVERQNLYSLIEFLHSTGLIEDDLKKRLHKYRDKRNKVLHDLLQEMDKEEFEKELKAACESGSNIMDDKSFSEMEVFLDGFEEFKENKKKEEEGGA